MNFLNRNLEKVTTLGRDFDKIGQVWSKFQADNIESIAKGVDFTSSEEEL